MTRTKKITFAVAVTLIAFAWMVFAPALKIHAAEEFTEVTDGDDIGISLGWTEGYEVYTGNAFSNGTTAYYTKMDRVNSKVVLYSYDIATGEEEAIKKLSNSDEDWYNIVKIYNGYIYINFSGFTTSGWGLYAYKISSGKYKKISKKYQMFASKGKYVVYGEGDSGDGMPSALYLGKLLSNGKIKKVKKLATYGASTSVTVIGNKFYFVAYTMNSDGEVTKAYVYKIKVSGGKMKKLATVSTGVAKYVLTNVTITKKYMKYYIYNSNDKLVKKKVKF